MLKRTRTFARRGTSKKLETRAHAARAYKRVVRQWELLLNIKCQIVEATPGADCPNGGKIVLVSNAELQGSAGYAANANFPDAMSIRRIQGHLYFRPPFTINGGPSINGCYANVFQNFPGTYMRMGLRKAQGPQSQSGIPDALNPLNNGATPSELSDYVDGRWMRLWEHMFSPVVTLGGQAINLFSCCSSQAGYTVPDSEIAEGTGTILGYDVPPVVCQPCGDVEDPAVSLGCTFQVRTADWWRVPINIGRRIVLKENDDLSLYFGWEKMRAPNDIARLEQSPMEFFGGLRMLLES